jgi:hypothetical protein
MELCACVSAARYYKYQSSPLQENGWRESWQRLEFEAELFCGTCFKTQAFCL